LSATSSDKHLLLLGQTHAADAARRAPHRPHVLFVEPHRLAGIGDEDHVLRAVGDLDADQDVILVERDGDDAGLARIGKSDSGVFFTVPLAVHMKM
jgi:uncharacterized protein